MKYNGWEIRKWSLYAVWSPDGQSVTDCNSLKEAKEYVQAQLFSKAFGNYLAKKKEES